MLAAWKIDFHREMERSMVDRGTIHYGNERKKLKREIRVRLQCHVAELVKAAVELGALPF
jgi:hypothetical protein